MERQVHARAEAEWQHALDLEKKLKASSRWGRGVCSASQLHHTIALRAAAVVVCHAMLAAGLCLACGWCLFKKAQQQTLIRHSSRDASETNHHPSVLTDIPPLPPSLPACLLCTCLLLCRKRSFYDAEVRSLRKQLRDTYESLLFLDAAFAAANDVEGQMWRTVFYLPIEEFRSRIRKAEKEAQQQQQKAAGGPAAPAAVSDNMGRGQMCVLGPSRCGGSMRMQVAGSSSGWSMELWQAVKICSLAGSPGCWTQLDRGRMRGPGRGLKLLSCAVLCCVLQGGPGAATILAKTAAAFLKFLDEAALFYKRLVMQLQVRCCSWPAGSLLFCWKS
jgi:hypothetical protein